MSGLQPQAAPVDFAAARKNMIESQIRPNKVRDERVLTAMETLPREMFVPVTMAGIAYIDEDLQVAKGRYLLEPMVLARFLEEAQIKSSDKVLDVACATGYSTAVIAAMAKDVVGLDVDPALVAQAQSNLAALGIKNARVENGALADGWKFNTPYDVIIINGGAEILPEELLLQLNEGGRLVVVMREYGPAKAAHRGEARLYQKMHGGISQRGLFDANVNVLPGFQAKPVFKF